MEGDGAQVSAPVGELTAPSREVVLISAGASHSVALLFWFSFSIFIWILEVTHGLGDDDAKKKGKGSQFGQLGVGDNVDHCSPVQVRFPDEEKVVQISCGWRHTLALTDRRNVFSWGRGTSGQLGHGDILDRNTPKLIEALSTDGFSCRYLKPSNVLPSSGKIWISPSERYAIVPDESVSNRGAKSSASKWSDVNVPQT